MVRRGVTDDMSVLGFRYGWAGVMDGDACDLTLDNTRGLLHRGGHDPRHLAHQPVQARTTAPSGSPRRSRDRGVDALIAIGGEDTLGVARRLGEHGIDVVGVPKTIDNDLAGTDFTFGFHTAVQIATDAIDRLHTTAESHNRVMVVEVMGRHAGWIATYSGMAGGADADPGARAARSTSTRCASASAAATPPGGTFSIVVVAEGATRKDGHESRAGERADAFGHARLGGIAVELERDIEERTGLRVAHDDPRARAARRHADRLRPRAGHPLRRGGGSMPCRAGAFGADGGAARHRDRARASRRGAARAQAAGSGPVRDRRGVLRMSAAALPRTKIVATIGPASDDAEVLARMVEAGMSVARLNFAHGTREEKARTAERVRAAAGRAGREVAILQDLPGPKLRIGGAARRGGRAQARRDADARLRLGRGGRRADA